MEQLDFVITVVMSACTNFDAIFHKVGSSDIITSSQILTAFQSNGKSLSESVTETVHVYGSFRLNDICIIT